MSGTTTTLALQDFNTLLQTAAAAAQASSTAAINLEDGSTIRAILESNVGQGLWLQYIAMQVLLATRLATSSNGDCDSFGNDFGFVRLPAIAATGQVTFSRYSSAQAAFLPVYIPATSTTLSTGVQVMTADGTQTFNLIADSTNSYYVAGPPVGYSIPAGVSSAVLPVVANVAGSSGNVLAGTISLMLGGIAGIDTITNSNATSGGIDAESDSAFKSRFVSFINSRSLATETAIDYAIQSVQQGLTWTIQENVSSTGSYQPGNFVVTVDDGSGSPVTSLITACQTAVEAVRPIGSTFYLSGPTKIAVNVEMTLTLTTGAIHSTIVSEVETALTNYINALSVGQTLPFSKLASVAYSADSNILNVTNVTLNGGTVDLVASSTQVYRVGTLVIS